MTDCSINILEQKEDSVCSLMAQSEINFETVCLEEQECLPVKQRCKLLLASHGIPLGLGWSSESQILDLPTNDGAVGEAVPEKIGIEECYSKSGCSSEERVTDTTSRAERHADKLGENDSRLHPGSLCVKYPVTVKVECADDDVTISSANCMNGSAFTGIQVVDTKPEMSDECFDELDHLVLKERLMKLLTSNCLGMNSTMLEENAAGTGKGELGLGDAKHAVSGNQIYETDVTLESVSLEGGGRTLLSGGIRTVQGSAVPSLANIKTEPQNYVESQSSSVTMAGHMCFQNLSQMKNEVDLASDEDELDHMLLRDRIKLLSSRQYPNLNINQSPDCQTKRIHSTLSCKPGGAKPAESLKVNRPSKRRKTVTDSIETAMEEDASGLLQENAAGTGKGELGLGDAKHAVSGNQIHETDVTLKSVSLEDGGRTLLSGGIRTVQGSAVPSLANIKTESQNYDEFQSSSVTMAAHMSFQNLFQVKREVDLAGDEDELDHMLLRDRMKLLSSRQYPSLNINRSSDCLTKRIPSTFSFKPGGAKPAESLKVNLPRKRRKTVTDSVETAMEEDAPGLLQILIGKGVSVDEIKLYSEPECDEALDDSSTSDNFTELEAVIAKLFSRRESLLKLGVFRCTKGDKPSYCLECLFSLVEQARYLQFQKWPAEWGWCRDLQSFIFVFERHNRIVLERPEYGYATYFFELADSLPIDWQIKRLVTAMKLTSCSRITLLENRALMVGDDLTEGEARVLMEYGWVPNTGLGTMLMYHDRVLHDRKNEKESSEWRTKIGKFLVDGYNGGTVIPSGIPINVMEQIHPLEIKPEV